MAKPSVEELINTDKEFSAYSEKHGMHKAFLKYIDENGVMLRDKSMPLVGKQALVKLYEGQNDTSFTLIWKPVKADIAQSGDLGYTYGIWTLKTEKEEKQGTYVSIWKKNPEGKWKFVLDSGNDGLE